MLRQLIERGQSSDGYDTPTFIIRQSVRKRIAEKKFERERERERESLYRSIEEVKVAMDEKVRQWYV